MNCLKWCIKYTERKVARSLLLLITLYFPFFPKGTLKLHLSSFSFLFLPSHPSHPSLSHPPFLPLSPAPSLAFHQIITHLLSPPPSLPPRTLSFSSGPDTHTHTDTLSGGESAVCCQSLSWRDTQTTHTRENFKNKLWSQLSCIFFFFFYCRGCRQKACFCFSYFLWGWIYFNRKLRCFHSTFWLLLVSPFEWSCQCCCMRACFCYCQLLWFILTIASLVSLFLSMCSKPPSRPTASCCQAPATLSPTPADTRQMQTLPAGTCTKTVLQSIFSPLNLKAFLS